MKKNKLVEIKKIENLIKEEIYKGRSLGEPAREEVIIFLIDL